MGKKIKYNPPTIQDVSKRKVYGGGETTLVTSKGRGWHDQSEEHSIAAIKGHAKRDKARITPESHKEKKVREHLEVKYPGGYSARLDEVGVDGVNKDITIISDGSKIETKHVKDDKEARYKVMEESVGVDKEKLSLEQKIHEYENKEDDKFIKEVKEEKDALNKREDGEEQFERDIAPSRNIIKEYETGTFTAAKMKTEKDKKEAEEKGREARAQASIEEDEKRRKINELTTKRMSLLNKLGEYNNELSAARREQNSKQEAYDNRIKSEKRRDKNATPEKLEESSKIEKVALEEAKIEVRDKDQEVTKGQRAVFDVNADLDDLGWKKGTVQEKQEVPKKKVRYEDTAEYKKYHPDRKDEQKKELVSTVPKSFHTRYPNKTDQEAWEGLKPEQRDNYLKKHGLTKEKGDIKVEVKDQSYKEVPDWYEEKAGIKPLRQRMWDRLPYDKKVQLTDKQRGDKSGRYRTGTPKGLKADYTPYTGNNEQTSDKSYNKRYQKDLPWQLEVKRKENVELVKEFERRYPKQKQEDNFEVSYTNFEFADEEVLRGFLRAGVSSDKRKIEDERRDLYKNIDDNRKEHKRRNR